MKPFSGVVCLYSALNSSRGIKNIFNLNKFCTIMTDDVKGSMLAL